MTEDKKENKGPPLTEPLQKGHRGGFTQDGFPGRQPLDEGHRGYTGVYPAKVEGGFQGPTGQAAPPVPPRGGPVETPAPAKPSEKKE